MKFFVITIMSNPKSVEVAKRCIESGQKFGHSVEHFTAITPEDNPVEIAKEEGIDISDFQRNEFSKFENLLSCFLSHYFLWKKCMEDAEEIFILEHDAVFLNSIPSVSHNGLITFGKPSFGKYKGMNKSGLFPLYSKGFVPGAHGYCVHPEFAKTLIQFARVKARPTDVFLSRKNFRDKIKEYSPWLIEARDSFSTVQNHKGCRAKHNFNNSYEFVQ